MLGHEALSTLDSAAGLLLRLAEQCASEGDEAGATAATVAANHVLALLDLDALRTREAKAD